MKDMFSILLCALKETPFKYERGIFPCVMQPARHCVVFFSLHLNPSVITSILFGISLIILKERNQKLVCALSFVQWLLCMALPSLLVEIEEEAGRKSIGMKKAQGPAGNAGEGVISGKVAAPTLIVQPSIN